MNIFAPVISRLRIIRFERYIYLFYALFIVHFDAFKPPLDESAN